MTEKEKVKAYDEAIERAKKSYGNRIAEEIFPELKEDDTERIKKNCIHFLELQKQHHAATFEIEECIAWLEKQGKNSTDKPRFKVGDWVMFIKSGSIYQVEKIENYEYTLRYIFGGLLCLPFSDEELIREWTIQDAKDGDVLSFYSEYKGNKMVQVGIIEKYVGKHGGCSNTFKIYVGVNWDNNLQIGEYMGCSDIHPATKEQHDALMKVINDAGYKWKAETKTLEKLVEHKFDPKTLKPFDKVLGRDSHNATWFCKSFSHIDLSKFYKYATNSGLYMYCIPYNDDTKHLVGTVEEAPEFYRYWEE